MSPPPLSRAFATSSSWKGWSSDAGCDDTRTAGWLWWVVTSSSVEANFDVGWDKLSVRWMVFDCLVGTVMLCCCEWRKKRDWLLLFDSGVGDRLGLEDMEKSSMSTSSESSLWISWLSAARTEKLERKSDWTKVCLLRIDLQFEWLMLMSIWLQHVENHQQK